MDRLTPCPEKEDSERIILITSWRNAFKRAADFDAWGQLVEALDIYQRLSKQLQIYSNSTDTRLFPFSQKKILEKIALCLDSRRRGLNLSTTIKDSSKKESISLKELKLLETTLENLMHTTTETSNEDQKFPIDVATVSAHLKSLSVNNDCQEDQDDITHNEGKGSLLPKPLPVSGKTHLTICIDHIGVKDSSHFLDPSISVSIKSQPGQVLSCIQETPPASRKVDFALIFNRNVHIEKALEALPQGFAVFFELKHFKPKKNAFSTYCWTFLEQDEMKEGPIALELYKKPADYQRKSLKLLTVKPLFLHLHLNIYG